MCSKAAAVFATAFVTVSATAASIMLSKAILQQEDYLAKQPQQENEDIFTATPFCFTAQQKSFAFFCFFNVWTNL